MREQHTKPNVLIIMTPSIRVYQADVSQPNTHHPVKVFVRVKHNVTGLTQLEISSGYIFQSAETLFDGKPRVFLSI